MDKNFIDKFYIASIEDTRVGDKIYKKDTEYIHTLLVTKIVSDNIYVGILSEDGKESTSIKEVGYISRDELIEKYENCTLRFKSDNK